MFCLFSRPWTSAAAHCLCRTSVACYFQKKRVMGSMQHAKSGSGQVSIWCPYKDDTTMGEIATEEMSISPQSDSEGSNSSIDMVGTPPNGEAIKCRWVGCGLWFGHLDLLASHVTRVHAAAGHGGLFYCGWEGCTRGNRGFNARYKMLVHVRTHTNEKPHHCFKCEKSFSRAENLKIHARSHTGERPYVCPVPGCGKAYSNSSDRFKHTRTHSVDKPYMCKVPGCPKRYTDPSSLRKHVKTYRHFPPSSSTVSNESSRQSPLAVAPRAMQLDCSGALAMGCEDQEAKVCGNEQCISPMPASPSVITPVVTRPEPEGLFHSWLDTDFAVLSRSLPWTGLWVHPFLRPTTYNPTEDAAQDLPLDLTMHRTGTRV